MSGYADGTGAAAAFNQPAGIAIDASGNLFVADLGNFTIRKITPAAVVTTLAGNPLVKSVSDGIGKSAFFFSPFAIIVDANDTLYVADSNAVRKVTASGSVTTLAGSVSQPGYADGPGSTALFNYIRGIAFGPSGSLLVSDFFNRAVRQISSSRQVSTVAGVAGEQGVRLGPLPTTLNGPTGLVYLWPTLYVIDGRENSVLAVSGIF